MGLAGKHLKSIRNGVLLLESGWCWCGGGGHRFAETRGEACGCLGAVGGFHGKAVEQHR